MLLYLYREMLAGLNSLFIVSTGWAIGRDFSVHVEVFLNVGLECCPRDEGFSIDGMNCIYRDAF